jgi:CheY-like chemotaxis protein
LNVEADEAALNSVRVIVVDDEQDTRDFLQMVLEDAGAEVLLATGGEEGLELAGREQFDIMTLDLSMPGRNGVEVFRELRNDPALQERPICIVTGHSELRGLLYERSARPPEGFLNKPVEPEMLVGTLRRILDLQQRRSER